MFSFTEKAFNLLQDVNSVFQCCTLMACVDSNHNK